MPHSVDHVHERGTVARRSPGVGGAVLGELYLAWKSQRYSCQTGREAHLGGKRGSRSGTSVRQGGRPIWGERGEFAAVLMSDREGGPFGGGRGEVAAVLMSEQFMQRIFLGGDPSPVEGPEDVTTKQIATTPMALHHIINEVSVSPVSSSCHQRHLQNNSFSSATSARLAASCWRAGSADGHNGVGIDATLTRSPVRSQEQGGTHITAAPPPSPTLPGIPQSAASIGGGNVHMPAATCSKQGSHRPDSGPLTSASGQWPLAELLWSQP